MRIAYLINYDISVNDGVSKKIAAQVREWRRLGHQVWVHSHYRTSGSGSARTFWSGMGGSITSRVLPNYPLLSSIRRFSPDVVYLRYDTFNVTNQLLLSRYKTVVELNTLDIEEARLLMNSRRGVKATSRFIVYRMLRSSVLSRINGIVAVTNEIANHPTVTRYRKPIAVVPNGISFESLPVVKTQHSLEGPIRCFFMGSPGQPWQGVDLIERLADRLTDFEFHFIGVAGKDIANRHYHGYLSREQYIRVLSNCHVCIGTMALHRKMMAEACPLKTREYLAHGFPVAIGYDDTAFKGRGPYHWLHRVADPVDPDVDAFRRFAIENRDTVVPRYHLRSIDLSLTEEQRVAFFAQIVGG